MDETPKSVTHHLTRIQMVVYLQAVDLFTYCTAEQMVRIASIVHQRHFAAGEKIYAANDPAEAMYCVAEGRVRLHGLDGEQRDVEAKGTFGVQEILSDRLRSEEAWALTDALALAIEAEDFFDLLSNNIEIVKALFRQLLRHPRISATEGADSRDLVPAAS